MLFHKLVNIKVIVLLLLFSLVSKRYILAQNEKIIDSLLIELEKEIPDTTRLFILNTLSFQYCFSNPNKAFIYAKKTINYSEKLKNKKYIGTAFFNRGVAYSMIGKLDSAEFSMREALSKSTEVKDSLNIARALNGLGNIFRSQSNLPIALDFFIQSLKIKEAMPQTHLNKREVAGGYIGIGIVYANLEEYDLAIDYLTNALNRFENLNIQKGIASSAVNLGYVYNAIEKYNQALELLLKALEAEKKGGNKDGISRILINLGNTYSAKGDKDAAIDSYQQSVNLFDELGMNYEKAEPLLGLAKISLKEGNLSESFTLANEAKELANFSKTLGVRSNAYKLLAEIYEKQNAYKNAFINYQIYIQLRDSLLSEDNQKKIIQLETQYAYEKREKELKLTQAKKENELQVRNQRNVFLLYGVALILLFVAFFAIFYFRYSRQLRQLNATKDKLFAIIAHDLKNPLSAFRSITQSLQSNINLISKEEVEYFLGRLNNSSSELYELLQNLLQWAINQSGQLDYQPKELSLSEISNSVIQQLGSNIEVKKHEVLTSINSNTFVFADEKMTRLILRNLISNAIKFTEEQGKIEVIAVAKNEMVQISVKDNGIGITKEDIKKLFNIEGDKMSIGESSEKGTGLGLILCKELAERQNGKIWVESKIGKGSSFIFTLPK